MGSDGIQGSEEQVYTTGIKCTMPYQIRFTQFFYVLMVEGKVYEIHFVYEICILFVIKSNLFQDSLVLVHSCSISE